MMAKSQPFNQRFVERHGRKFYNPSLGSICLTIVWATVYAPKEYPLNESHPKWADYFAYSEWFRLRICAQLKLPLETEWEMLYRRTGTLIEEEYDTPEDFKKALDFGEANTLHDRMAPEMFVVFEEIKHGIVGRL